jgi:hypothetical protein
MKEVFTPSAAMAMTKQARDTVSRPIWITDGKPPIEFMQTNAMKTHKNQGTSGCLWLPDVLSLASR